MRRGVKWFLASTTGAALVAASYWAIVRVSSQSASRSPNQSGASVQQLRDIGATVAKAVLGRDLETILRYDRPDLRLVDRAALNDPGATFSVFYLIDRVVLTVDPPFATSSQKLAALESRSSFWRRLTLLRTD